MLRIMFAGTPILAKNILQDLVTSGHQIVTCLSQPDKPAGRGKKLAFTPVKQFAITNNIPILQPTTLKTTEFYDVITSLKLDVVVVVAYGVIIPKELLAIPKYGFINIHMSLLPRWRGASPIQYAILEGDKETGVSIMQMDAELDTGDILSVARIPIHEQDTSGMLQEKLCSLGSRELLTVLNKLSIGTIATTKQDSTKATYAAKITKAVAQINWQHSTENIIRQIRAYNPWPIAFVKCQTTTIRIWHALPWSLNNNNAMPGTILATTKYGIDVATIDGIIRLQTIQLSGKKPLAVKEIINANYNLFAPGTILQ